MCGIHVYRSGSWLPITKSFASWIIMWNLYFIIVYCLLLMIPLVVLVNLVGWVFKHGWHSNECLIKVCNLLLCNKYNNTCKLLSTHCTETKQTMLESTFISLFSIYSKLFSQQKCHNYEEKNFCKLIFFY